MKLTHMFDEEPEWLKLIAEDGRVGSVEVARLFGFCSRGALWSSVHSGSFPKPDYENFGFRGSKLNMWKASTLRQENARRKQLKEEEEQ